MKRLIFFTAFVLSLVHFANAQGYTLQYNQTKLVGSVETVPAGKTWKITGILPSTRLSSAYCSGSTSCGYTQTEQIILVNGNNVWMASSDARGSSYGYVATAIINTSDIWLPEGTTLAAGTGVYRVSVLEFNMIAP